MKKITTFFFNLSVIVMGLFPRTAVYAVDTGLEVAKGQNIFQQGDIPVIVGYIIYSALGVIGVVFLALTVYAGVLWMTAQGDEKKISTARAYLFHSILGIIIVLSSFAITKFVIETLAKPTLI